MKPKNKITDPGYPLQAVGNNCMSLKHTNFVCDYHLLTVSHTVIQVAVKELVKCSAWIQTMLFALDTVTQISKEDRLCTYNVTLRHIRATSVAV
jgi:hypothetical protein